METELLQTTKVVYLTPHFFVKITFVDFSQEKPLNFQIHQGSQNMKI